MNTIATFTTQLDTLAQLPTKKAKNGKLYKRARSKFFTQEILSALLKKCPDSPLKKQYQRALFCGHVQLQTGNQLKSTYCNSRACHVCNRIRTAKMMNAYLIPLQGLGELEFVTLTVPNVPKSELREKIKELTKVTANIFRVFRERRGIELSGIRKIESTYNKERNDYHPHVHLLVNKGKGTEIVEEWLKRFPAANISAQDVRKADKDSLNELFKYTTKIYKRQKRNAITINAEALDAILQAFDGLRTFQPFGEIRKIEVSEDVDEIEVQEYDELPEIELDEVKEWIYCNQLNDWLDDNGNKLTNYKRPNIKFHIE